MSLLGGGLTLPTFTWFIPITQLNLTTEMQANPVLHRGLVLQGAPVKADGRMGRRISTAPL